MVIIGFPRFARDVELFLLRYQLQLVGGQDFSHLVARVDGPRPNRVETGISLPVSERLARLAGFFISQCQIVMRVSVRWGE